MCYNNKEDKIMKKTALFLLCAVMIFALAVPVFAGSADEAVKAATLTLGAEFAPADINNAIEMRGFTASPDGKYVYGGFLQGGRYVVRFNTSDNSPAGDYKPSYTSDNELYCKGLAVDDRGILFIGVTHNGKSDIGIVAVDKDMKEIGRKVDDLGSKTGINGVAVQKTGDKYYLYAVTAYNVDSVRCYDVTDPANITLNTAFGNNGVMDYAGLIGGQGDPSYIAVDSQGTIYLTYLKSGSGKGSHVAKIGQNGKTLIAEAAVTQAYGICEAGDYVFVATYDKANSCVKALDKSDLSEVATLKYAEQKNNLSDIAYGGNTLFVGDHGDNSAAGGAYYKAEIKLAADGGKAGDVNKDGVVNNKDVVALFKHVSGGDATVDETACDCNGDGSVNNKDVTLLFKYSSGANVEIFYGKTIVLPDTKLTYVDGTIYADQATAAAHGVEVPTNGQLSGWFEESSSFDDDWNVLAPAPFGSVDNYALHIASGKYIQEVSVLHVKNRADVSKVKEMAEYRRGAQEKNQDYVLYDDENKTNEQMIGKGKVATYGNFVIYACTLDTDLSLLRAEKQIAENPSCTAYDVLTAVMCELK